MVNHEEFQDLSPSINTCGRWVGLRILHRDKTDAQFKAFVMGKVKEAGAASPDDWVTDYTSPKLSGAGLGSVTGGTVCAWLDDVSTVMGGNMSGGGKVNLSLTQREREQAAARRRLQEEEERQRARERRADARFSARFIARNPHAPVTFTTAGHVLDDEIEKLKGMTPGSRARFNQRATSTSPGGYEDLSGYNLAPVPTRDAQWMTARDAHRNEMERRSRMTPRSQATFDIVRSLHASPEAAVRHQVMTPYYRSVYDYVNRDKPTYHGHFNTIDAALPAPTAAAPPAAAAATARQAREFTAKHAAVIQKWLDWVRSAQKHPAVDSSKGFEVLMKKEPFLRKLVPLIQAQLAREEHEEKASDVRHQAMLKRRLGDVREVLDFYNTYFDRSAAADSPAAARHSDETDATSDDYEEEDIEAADGSRPAVAHARPRAAAHAIVADEEDASEEEDNAAKTLAAVEAFAAAADPEGLLGADLGRFHPLPARRPRPPESEDDSDHGGGLPSGKKGWTGGGCRLTLHLPGDYALAPAKMAVAFYSSEQERTVVGVIPPGLPVEKAAACFVRARKFVRTAPKFQYHALATTPEAYSALQHHGLVTSVVRAKPGDIVCKVRAL